MKSSQGCFVSDLHWLSPRSMAPRCMPAIDAACRDSQLIVLGGDIFDFRWSNSGSHSQTLFAIRNWLTELMSRHPHAAIVYVLGNHDSHHDLCELLDELTRYSAAFQWHEQTIQIADCLFCHGDVLDAGSRADLPRYRAKFQHEQPASRTAHRIYDAAVAMRLHKTIPKLFHRPRATCQRLSDLLSINAQSANHSAVKRVFFGHTHVPIYELMVGGVEYFNPGAALRHMNFAPITFQIELT